jgi:hypothetical protein
MLRPHLRKPIPQKLLQLLLFLPLLPRRLMTHLSAPLQRVLRTPKRSRRQTKVFTFSSREKCMSLFKSHGICFIVNQCFFLVCLAYLSFTWFFFLYKRQGMIRAFAFSRLQYIIQIQRVSGSRVLFLLIDVVASIRFQRFYFHWVMSLLILRYRGDTGEIGEIKSETPPTC